MHGAAWLKARDPNHFTLQLLSSHSRASIERYARDHALTGGAAFFHSVVDGKSWYTLVSGDYADRASAEAAVKGLPPTLRNSQPWIRRFDDIQTAMGSAATPVPSKALTAPPAALPAQVDKAAAAENPHDEAWIWSQDPRSYTLQLIGARQESNILDFLHNHKLSGKAVYFRTQHNGSDWYTLIYGVYPDREHALQAIRELPRTLREGSPWARTFASIHTELSHTERPATPN